jgi:hypothetical protein
MKSCRTCAVFGPLDTKSEEYIELKDDAKAKLIDWKVIEFFRHANTKTIKTPRDFLLPKKEKGPVL